MTWTWIHFVSLLVSFLLFLIIGLTSNALTGTGQSEYWTMEYMMTDFWSYLTVILVAVTSVLPRFTITVLRMIFNPPKWHKIRRSIFHQKPKNLTVNAYY